MKVTKDMLDQLVFRSWWIRHNAKAVLDSRGMLRPKRKDYLSYFEECMKYDTVTPK